MESKFNKELVKETMEQVAFYKYSESTVSGVIENAGETVRISVSSGLIKVSYKGNCSNFVEFKLHSLNSLKVEPGTRGAEFIEEVVKIFLQAKEA